MNKYKLISMAAALLIVIAGCVYLAFGSITLAAVLGICIVAICVMGGACAAEARASGQKGIVPYIPSLCFFVLAGAVSAALVIFLMKN